MICNSHSFSLETKLKHKLLCRKGWKRRAALLTAQGVDCQKEEAAGEDGRPREPHGFLCPSTAKLLLSALLSRTISDDTIDGHGRTRQKRPRFSTSVLLCSRRSPLAYLFTNPTLCTSVRFHTHVSGPRDMWEIKRDLPAHPPADRNKEMIRKVYRNFPYI